MDIIRDCSWPLCCCFSPSSNNLSGAPLTESLSQGPAQTQVNRGPELINFKFPVKHFSLKFLWAGQWCLTVTVESPLGLFTHICNLVICCYKSHLCILMCMLAALAFSVLPHQWRLAREGSRGGGRRGGQWLARVLFSEERGQGHVSTQLEECRPPGQLQ